MKFSINLLSLIVAVLAFLLAAFSTWLQFRSVPDRVSLTGGGRVLASAPIQIKDVYNLNTKAMDIAIGPISWRFQVYNPTNKSISLTNFSMTHITKEGRCSSYSNLPFDVSRATSPNEVVSGAETIGPNEARSYMVTGYLPIQSTQEQRENCLIRSENLFELEQCFVLHGTDFFGREIVVSTSQDDNLSVTTHSFVAYQAQDQLLLTLTLGDGSKDELEFSY